MTIETYLPQSFSEIGQRPTNQDALFPFLGLANQLNRLFVVCDGMGGADKGEVASHLLCEAVARYEAIVQPPVFDGDQVKQVLANALNQYADYMRANPLVNRMGSTIAILQFHKQGATITHVGDSRIYQIRRGQIIFQTNDHKEVNNMVDDGIITAEQAKTHPWRNRLSRAVALSSTDLASSDPKIPEPDLAHITDIQKGDYFVLCTDGFLEQVDDYALGIILKSEVSDQTKLRMLLKLCENRVKDNYSGYIIHIKAVYQDQPVVSTQSVIRL